MFHEYKNIFVTLLYVQEETNSSTLSIWMFSVKNGDVKMQKIARLILSVTSRDIFPNGNCTIFQLAGGYGLWRSYSNLTGESASVDVSGTREIHIRNVVFIFHYLRENSVSPCTKYAR